MLNIEKYIDKLIEIGVIDISKLTIVCGTPHICERTNCLNCPHHDTDKSCEELVEEWLFSEHEEWKVDWSKVKVDTPILVRDFEKEAWERRYFAGFEDGKVCAWSRGLTSWTVEDENDVCFWKYAKLAESEEQEDE